MEARELTHADVRSTWSTSDDELVVGWEFAIAWDDDGNPTHWRRLDPSNREDERRLWNIGRA
jgi:hypothetical protein